MSESTNRGTTGYAAIVGVVALVVLIVMGVLLLFGRGGGGSAKASPAVATTPHADSPTPSAPTSQTPSESQSPSPSGSASPVALTPLTESQTIDPYVGEVFAVPDPNASPVLSEEQAWSAYTAQQQSPNVPIPAGMTVYLGSLTLPVGPNAQGVETYHVHNELAYGFASPSPCRNMNPRVTTPPSNNCMEWTFLDAATGAQIDTTWQNLNSISPSS
jgi:cytoskeletal protein RodZ